MTIPQLAPGEVATRLASDAPPVLLDVRTPGEYATARIDGAVLIPLDELSMRTDELDPDAPLVVMCHHGVRSLHAAMYLARCGFDDVANLRGGIERWSREVDPAVPLY